MLEENGSMSKDETLRFVDSALASPRFEIQGIFLRLGSDQQIDVEVYARS